MPMLPYRTTALRPAVFTVLAQKRAQRSHHVLPLHIGDTFLLPPVRLTAPENPDDPSLYLYQTPQGEPAFRASFSSYLAQYGIDAVAEEMIVTGGATHGIFLLALSLLAPGDEMMLLSPYWPLIPGIVHAAGGVGVEVPFFPALREGKEIQTLLSEKLSKKTRVIYFASPNNPDGSVLSRSQLEQIVSFAKMHDLWVISDEVYLPYVYEGEAAFSARLLDKERVVSAYSLSKSHALAGIRLGFLVAPSSLQGALQRFMAHTLFQVPVYAQRVGQEALLQGEAWIENTKEQYRKARDLVCQKLQAKFFLPRAGAYVFLDLSEEAKGDIWKVIETLLDAGVSLAPGEAFGPSFVDWARFCFTAVSLEELSHGVEKLNQVLPGLR